MHVFQVLDSPLGPLLLVENAGHLEGLHFLDEEPPDRTPTTLEMLAKRSAIEHARSMEFAIGEVLEGEAERQLDRYFAGESIPFDLPLAPVGTPYQKRVWEVLTRIPRGTVWTYGDVARALGNTHARPVGGAVSKNPIAIVIPCHRVVAGASRLGGFAGGVERKWELLRRERAGELLDPGPPRFESRFMAHGS